MVTCNHYKLVKKNINHYKVLFNKYINNNELFDYIKCVYNIYIIMKNY